MTSQLILVVHQIRRSAPSCVNARYVYVMVLSLGLGNGGLFSAFKPGDLPRTGTKLEPKRDTFYLMQSLLFVT